MQKILLSNHPFNLILAQEFIGALAFFAPKALLISYFHDVLHLTPTELSSLLFIMIFCSRIGRVFFAPFFDRLNIAYLLFSLQLLCAIGFFLLTQHQSIKALYLGVFLIGIFYGNNAIIVRIATSFLKAKSLSLNYSMISTVTNIAAFIGSIILGYIYYQWGHMVMLDTISIFLILTSFFSYRSTRKIVFLPQGKFFTHLNLIRQKKILIILSMITLLWILFSFFMTYLPLYAIDQLKQPHLTWLVTTINGAIALSLSYGIHFLMQRMSNYSKIIVAFALYLISLLFINLTTSFTVFFLIIILVSLAEIISVPCYQSIMAENTDTHERFAIFSLLIICVGLGEALGTMLAVFTNNNHHHMMIIISILLISLIFLWLWKNKSRL